MVNRTWARRDQGADKMMKRTALLLLGATLPWQALAEDVFIRVEAKRSEASAQAAAVAWQQKLGDLPVAIFPLGSEWTAIGLGPLPREKAEARMQALKQSRSIPADSLLTQADGVDATGITDAASDRTGAVSIDDAPEPAASGSPSTAGLTGDGAAEAAPEAVEPPAPQHYIRMASFADRAEAEAALTERRRKIPEAGLWQLPNDRFAIVAGPLSETAARQWLKALQGEAIPSDSLIATGDELGQPLDQGTTPEWPEAPETSAEMPPVAEMQDTLQWAGFYDGEIDGKTGPQTRASLAAAVAAQRQSPDPAQVLQALRDERQAWRDRMGFETLTDAHTGLALSAPMTRLQHDRDERALSIYGPKGDSGAALILFSQPGGQQEMLDMTGLITALGWVPAPSREIGRGSASLTGRDDTHIGRAEARVNEGRVEGWVLVWPVEDAQNAPRIASEIAATFERVAPPRSEQPVEADAGEATEGEATAAEGEAVDAPADVPQADATEGLGQ